MILEAAKVAMAKADADRAQLESIRRKLRVALADQFKRGSKLNDELPACCAVANDLKLMISWYHRTLDMLHDSAPDPSYELRFQHDPPGWADVGNYAPHSSMPASNVHAWMRGRLEELNKLISELK